MAIDPKAIEAAKHIIRVAESEGLETEGALLVSCTLLDVARASLEANNALRDKDRDFLKMAEWRIEEQRRADRAEAILADMETKLVALQQAVRDAQRTMADRRKVCEGEDLKLGLGLAEEILRLATAPSLDEVGPEQKKFQPKVPVSWSKKDYRGEWRCVHEDGPRGPGHGNHIHGCDGCCAHPSYPGRSSS